MFNEIIIAQQNYLKYNNLIEKNTFIDFDVEPKILRKTKSLNDIKLKYLSTEIESEKIEIPFTVITSKKKKSMSSKNNNIVDLTIDKNTVSKSEIIEKKYNYSELIKENDSELIEGNDSELIKENDSELINFELINEGNDSELIKENDPELINEKNDFELIKENNSELIKESFNTKIINKKKKQKKNEEIKKKNEEIKKNNDNFKFKEKDEFDEDRLLMNNIMRDVDIDIIKRGVLDEMKFIINNFKAQNKKIIECENKNKKNDRYINSKIACMYKHIDTQVAIFLSNIRNKLYLDIVFNFEKLKEEKRLDLYINEVMILEYRDEYIQATRELDAYVKL